MSDSDTPLPALYRAVQAELKAAWPDRADFDLGDWILAQRKTGKSFPEIGYAIRDAIGQYVSHETLRRWARETEARPEPESDETDSRHGENLARWEANHSDK